jgi:glutamate dehydrogenase (NAD(P)+)
MNDTHTYGCVTGKPVAMQGIPGRREATGLGVFYGVRACVENAETMHPLGLEPGTAGKRVIVQGLGNVGYHAACFFQRLGDSRVTGIAEREGGVFNADGLDVEAVFRHRQETGSILGFPGAEDVPDSMSLLERDCDILVPAALENQITAQNAGRIAAKIIAEAANGPIDFDGETILRTRGVLMIPDLYLNAGGVTVSYFEWLKNRAGVSFDRMHSRHEELVKRELIEQMEALTGTRVPCGQRERLIRGPGERELVIAALEQTMIRAYAQIHEFWKSQGLPDLRTAAFLMAIERVGTSYLHHGIFP